MSAHKVKVKICGLTTPEAVDIACANGANYIGFVLVESSPRAISSYNAACLAAHLPSIIHSVAVCVDPDDAFLDAMLRDFRPNYLQLHGDETPSRVREIAQHTGLRIIKALRVATLEDLAPAAAYTNVAHMLLLDAKPSNTNEIGGTGQSFDWSLLDEFTPPLPWFLSGGLTCENVHEAITRTHAQYLDVSSGVEARKGIKDHQKIISFLEIAQQGR